MPAAARIAAAGGVVWRGQPLAPEVAVVHRPRYDDWSLPKGKSRPGESSLDTAVREIGEELGATVAVSRRIGSVHYSVPGARKTVTYWVMRQTAGSFSAGDEVDQVEWLPVKAARRLLSYDGDRTVLADFASIPVPDAVVLLVRHGKAGKRSEWRGKDVRRPLDITGEQQAARLVGLLGHFAPTRIVAANLTRCEQTVAPLARARNLPVEIDARFADDQLHRGSTAAALLCLAKPDTVTVVCSQGVTIPTLVEELVPGELHTGTRKAAVWALAIVDGDVASADYYEDALA